MLSTLVYMSFCAMMLVQRTDGQSIEDVRTLITDLKSNYSRNIRPVANKSDALTLYTNVYVLSINEYNEVTESFSAVFFLQVQWKDASIQWTPASYNNIQVVELFYKEVWVPPLLLVNPADTSSAIASQNWDWQQVIYTADGTASMVSNEKIHTTCSANVIAYPFDVQTCTSRYFAVGYSSSEIIIHPNTAQLDMSYYFGSSTWDIIESTQTSVLRELAYEWRITIKIKRRASFIVINTVMPILVLGLLKNLVYLLPAEEGERAGYCITVLLAISVFMTIVSDSMPKSSDPISLFTIYLLVELMMNLFVAVIAVLNMRLVYRSDQTPVNETVVYIMRVCCGCNSNSEVEPTASNKGEAVMVHHDNVHHGNVQHAASRLEVVNGDDRCPTHGKELTWTAVSLFIDKVCFISSMCLTVLIFVMYIIVANAV